MLSARVGAKVNAFEFSVKADGAGDVTIRTVLVPHSAKGVSHESCDVTGGPSCDVVMVLGVAAKFLGVQSIVVTVSVWIHSNRVTLVVAFTLTVNYPYVTSVP